MQEAADWLVRQQEKPLTETEQNQFEKWQKSSDSNQFAWQRAQHFINQVDSLPKDIACALLNRPDDAIRRLNIGKLALLLASGPLVWGSYKTIETQQWNADYRTAKGQKKQVTLPDGTLVTLNTATAFDIVFDQSSRLLSLREGEIEVNTVTTGPQESKPFTIKTQEAFLSPLDANFTVRQYSELTRVGVIQGSVHVTPKLVADTNGHQIEAGLQADLSSYTVLSKQPLSAETTSWLDNMLAVHNMPLNTFIQEVSRYHSGILRVSPDVQKIEVSGAFPIQDINIILNMLSNTYPINLKHHLGNYWVTLESA
jgi:transmembrane sensor